MADDKKTIGVRLAIRTEGEWLKAYVAMADTMDDAMLVGSLLKAIAESDDALWLRWKALMSNVMAGAVAKAFGVEPEMTERSAPEHERSGRA